MPWPLNPPGSGERPAAKRAHGHHVNPLRPPESSLPRAVSAPYRERSDSASQRHKATPAEQPDDSSGRHRTEVAPSAWASQSRTERSISHDPAARQKSYKKAWKHPQPLRLSALDPHDQSEVQERLALL